MLIDGFTLVAQIVNFLILVWLLKRFLYKPILNAIDQREKHIALQMEEADNRKAEAAKELAAYQQMNEEFKNQRQKLLNKAVSEVDAERIRLLDELHLEVEMLRLDYLETLRREQQTFSSEITQLTQKQVFDIARKTLRDLASVSLEEQIAKAFLNKLEIITDEERKQMVAGFMSTHNPVIIRSSFNLSHDLQSQIKLKIKEVYQVEPTIIFETTPRLVSGITLIFGGLKIMWSIDEYLNELKNNLTELIKEKYQVNT